MALLALDIGGTKIGWAIIEGDPTDLHIVTSDSIPTQAFDGGSRVAERICDLVRGCLADHKIDGVAVASAGVVDPNTGNIISATGTMPGWGGIKLGDILREVTGLPVWAINDVHAHGLGEATLGAGRNYGSVLACAVGTGIGGAHIVNGEIAFGEHFLAGHIGHIHHHFADGQPCSCGRTGHIEAICSGSGITSWFNSRSADKQVKNGKELQDLADGGDQLAVETFEKSAYALGQTLGSLANALDPAVVVLSGSMTKSGENWWREVRRGYRDSAMDFVANLDLQLGELGSHAPLFGAALYYYAQEKN